MRIVRARTPRLIKTRRATISTTCQRRAHVGERGRAPPLHARFCVHGVHGCARARARARMVRLSGNVRHVYFTNDTAARMYDFVGRMNEIMARAPVRLGFFEGP